MNNLHYLIYLLVDRHPIILIIMMIVIYMLASNHYRDALIRQIKGDKKARRHGFLALLTCVFCLMTILNVTDNHWEAITGQHTDQTMIYGHQYDMINQDTILHSPVCPCKINNTYHSDSIDQQNKTTLQ